MLIIFLLLLDKFAPYSAFMSGFEKNSFGKLIIGLAISSVLFISYGIYSYMTYQPSFIDITIDSEKYTIFGDIGDMGYYADSLVYKNEKEKIYIVSWNELDNSEETVDIHITYDSGTEEVWNTTIKELEEEAIVGLRKNYDIQAIYELTPHTFKESGKTKIEIDEQSFYIDIKQAKH